MKTLLLFFFWIGFTLSAFAQESSNADDAILLDYYQNQRFDDAFNYLKKTYPEPLTDLKILARLAYSSQMAGKLPEAESYYQRIYAVDSTNTAVLFNLGGINIRRGNNAQALEFYKKILLKDSTNFNVYKQMATLAQNSGDIKNAIIYFQKANKINPVEPDVAYDLSTFYINLQQYKTADTVINFALQADTGNLLLLQGKASIAFRLEKHAETVLLCNKLIQAGVQTSTIINMLGSSYFILKNYQNCISTFKLLEDGNTASETSYYYTAMSYKALGQQNLAIDYFNKAIKEAVSPNVSSYYGEMADTYDQLHQPKKAVSNYQKGLLYGIMPLSYYSIANLYDTELKNKALAVTYYKKYIKSNPPAKEKSYVAYAKSRIKELAN